MTIQKYFVGFILSVVLTLVAFAVVWLHVVSGHGWPLHELIIPAILVLTLLQSGVQLYYFLHLGEGSAARERVWALAVATLVVGILVVGSFWIMTHLNSRMNPAQMQMYMNSQSGL